MLSLWSSAAFAQDRTGYILGDQHGLEMMVHIMGEVQKPGEYRVPDQTDILQLLSKAGGPTQFSRLSGVTLRRVVVGRPSASLTSAAPPGVEIIHVNLERALQDKNAPPPPMLMPGDVVVVPKNAWNRWKDFSAIVRDVSVIASAYFLYLRATRD